jgi:hypothetical protein
VLFLVWVAQSGLSLLGLFMVVATVVTAVLHLHVPVWMELLWSLAAGHWLLVVFFFAELCGLSSYSVLCVAQFQTVPYKEVCLCLRLSFKGEMS